MKAILLVRVSTEAQDFTEQEREIYQMAINDGYKPEDIIPICEKVVAKDCDRTDIAYWQVKPNMHFTYKLELVKEYTGNKLDEEDLIQHGFNGGRSIQHPLKNNVELLNYIDSVFEEA